MGDPGASIRSCARASWRDARAQSARPLWLHLRLPYWHVGRLSLEVEGHHICPTSTQIIVTSSDLGFRHTQPPTKRRDPEIKQVRGGRVQGTTSSSSKSHAGPVRDVCRLAPQPRHSRRHRPRGDVDMPVATSTPPAGGDGNRTPDTTDPGDRPCHQSYSHPPTRRSQVGPPLPRRLATSCGASTAAPGGASRGGGRWTRTCLKPAPFCNTSHVATAAGSERGGMDPPAASGVAEGVSGSCGSKCEKLGGPHIRTTLIRLDVERRRLARGSPRRAAFHRRQRRRQPGHMLEQVPAMVERKRSREPVDERQNGDVGSAKLRAQEVRAGCARPAEAQPGAVRSLNLGDGRHRSRGQRLVPFRHQELVEGRGVEASYEKPHCGTRHGVGWQQRRAAPGPPVVQVLHDQGALVHGQATVPHGGHGAGGVDGRCKPGEAANNDARALPPCAPRSCPRRTTPACRRPARRGCSHTREVKGVQ